MFMSICKICGWPLPKYEPDPILFTVGDICVCCGSHFGLDDKILKHVRARRQRWLNAGAEWIISEEKPEDWNLEEQLANIPEGWC